MKRKLIIVASILLVAIGALGFYLIRERNPEVRRERYLKQAREHVAQGKLNEAVIMFGRAVQVAPRSAEIRYELGMAQLRRSNFIAAFGELRRAVDLDGKSIAARYQLGTLYLLARDAAQAKEQLNKIREQAPESMEARFLAARALVSEKDPDGALRELQEHLAKHQPKSPTETAEIYLNIGAVYGLKRDFTAAEAAYRKALEIDPKMQRIRIALASLYFGTGKRDQAEQELMTATKADPENDELLYTLGNLYRLSGRFQEYQDLYLALLTKKPDSLVAKKRLAEITLARGDMVKTKSYVEQILKADPGDTDGHFFNGLMLLHESKHSKAAEEFALVTRNAPGFAPGFFNLGLAHLAENQLQKAKAALGRAVELNPSWLQPHLKLAAAHVATQDFDLAWQESEKILALDPKNEDALSLGGAAMVKKGNLAKANELFKKQQEIAPNSAAAHSNLGSVYLLQKKIPEALKSFEQALEQDQSRIEAISAIAQVYVAQGKASAATERVNRQVNRVKNPAPLYQLLGQLKLDEKDPAQAIAYLEKAVNTDPNLLTAYQLLGNAHLEQQKFDQAIANYQKVLEKNPKSLATYLFIGVAHEKKQQISKANEFYEKALEINKDFAPAANNLAWNYAEHGGNLDTALALAQKALGLNPGNPVMGDTLGWVYFKRGAYPTAIGYLKDSNDKFQEKNAGVLYHLGMAYHRSGDKALARDKLSKALTLDGNAPEAKAAREALVALGG